MSTPISICGDNAIYVPPTDSCSDSCLNPSDIIAGDNVTVEVIDGEKVKISSTGGSAGTVVAVPQVTIGDYVYNGKTQSPTIVVDTSKVYITGDTAVDAGTYTLTIALKNTVNLVWDDDTQTPKTYTWSIAKAQPTLTTNKDSVTLNPDNTSDTVIVSSNSPAVISASSDNTSVATVSLNGNTATISSVDDASGSATIIFEVPESTNYLSASKTVSVTAAFAQVYGAEWDGTANQQWSRTDLAADFVDPVPAVANGTGSSPFDNIAPWSEMTRVEDAEAGTLVKIPKYWFKWTRNGDAMKLQISTAPAEGFFVSPAHADRGDGKGERDVVYVGRYHSADDYKSKTGVMPVSNLTRDAFRQGISALGDTIWQWDFAMYWTIAMLYLVEFAHWNSQEKIGYGCGNTNAKINEGSTDAMQYHTGTDAATRQTYGNVQYRNIEGLWSNVLDWLDGIRFATTDIFAIKNPSEFSDSTGGVNVGTRAASSANITGFTTPSVEGFEYALYPDRTSGSNYTQYIGDHCYYNSSGVVLCVGGSFNYRNQYLGLFYLSGNYSASSRSAVIGSRLQKLP